MYESVIRPSPTSIMHGDKSMQPHVSRAFRAMPEKAPKLTQGEMALPVMIDSHDIVSDPTMSNYETPMILPGRGIPANLSSAGNLVNVSKKDASRLKNKLAAKKTLDGKLAARNL